ncbi:MAG: hypothetical protein LBL46_04495 [Rickettsiales bacterium]|jgi:membrane protease YdiL (CAAX protease family)|nr:hypothetical protein [Rickettsiales bacterium]
MKTLKTIAFAGFAALFGGFAAQAADTGNICGLIAELGNVFKTLRILCFAGAAFVIMAWAWGFIKDGKYDFDKDIKGKGLAMLIGFILLFGVGLLLSYLPEAGNCARNAF